jgi:CRP-like cAMP-binding protein
MVTPEELEQLHLLQQFAPNYVKQLAALARLEEYDEEDVIFLEGQPALQIYLVLRGEVALDITVADRGVIRVHKVGPEELLGWSPLLRGGAMTATAHALTRCRLAALDVTQIRALAERDPRFGMEFFRCLASALAERLRSTRLQLADPGHHHMLAIQEGAD